MLRFCSLVGRLWRWVSGGGGLFRALLAVALAPLWGVWLAVRGFCFVRFPRPARCPSGLGSVWFALRGSSAPVGWRCVPVSALPAVRRSCFVWAVRPAVVRRRSGVVCFVWCWVSPAPTEL